MVPFLFACLVYVAGRMVWYRSDRLRPWYWLLLIALGQSALIGVVVDGSIRRLISTAVAIIVLALLAFTTESALATSANSSVEANRRSSDIFRLLSRLCVLLVGLVSIGCLAGTAGLVVRPQFHQLLQWAASRLAFGAVLTQASWPVVWSRMLGLVLCLFEAGTVVRLSMLLMNVGAPVTLAAKFKHSALIGEIERLLVLVFVFNSAFNAVAFILTAKSVVRFHDTVQTDAAEYVLIGTLLSTLVAIAIGLALHV